MKKSLIVSVIALSALLFSTTHVQVALEKGTEPDWSPILTAFDVGTEPTWSQQCTEA